MSNDLQQAIARIEQLTGKPAKKSGDGYIACCPCHDDSTASLSVKAGNTQPFVVHCHAGCDPKSILAAINLNGTKHQSKQIVATYPYQDETGKVVFEKVRYFPKDFRIRYRPKSGGDWIWKKPTGEPPLYQLPEVLAGIKEGKTIFVVEGEKDADRLRQHGLIATCNFDGAGKWRESYSDVLSTAPRIIIIPDNDAPGLAHANSIELETRGNVRILQLDGLPDHGDVSDWLDSGRTIAELLKLADKPVEQKPKPAEAKKIIELPSVSLTTHLANSYRIKQYYHNQLQYVIGMGWIMWDGKFWRSDQTNDSVIALGFVNGLSRFIAEESIVISQESANEKDKEKRKALMHQSSDLMRWAIQSESEGVISAGLKLAKYQMLVEYDTLNKDKYLLNVQNGTLDLRTGKLRDHDPADMITFLAPVAFDPFAKCPTWDAFLLQVFAGDVEMVEFICRAIGWSLTGTVKERALFFLYGNTGKNGKTTLVEAVMKLLGTCGESSYGYGRKVGADTFMKSKNSEDNQRKSATLAGPRFVCTSEVDEEHRLNEQLIKDITGGDTLEGRKLYKEAFTFKPEFKPWMYGNHKPEIRGTDDAIWSRVRLIPFDVSFQGREDQDLPDKLEAELPGILNWALRGCMEWQKIGLRPPARVQAATQAYREEMDVFGAFMEARCVRSVNATVYSSELWAAYREWCVETGSREQTQTKLGKYLTAKGFPVETGLAGKKRRIGLGLISTD